MNKYILMLGIAAVSIGSYCAYAGNSATMTVTATIEHDVSLTVTQDIDFGTITINPAYWDPPQNIIQYDSTGKIWGSECVVSGDDVTFGEFTANIPNPSSCQGDDYCGGLGIVDDFNFGEGNTCDWEIRHTSGNNFSLQPFSCYINNPNNLTAGEYRGTITINYTPES